MILFVLFILLIVGVIVWVTWKLTDIAANRPSKPRKPTIKTIKTTNWLVDCDCAEKYFKFYRDELVENDEYFLSAKELKEDYCDEKVYKYYPLELPLQMNGFDVYSKTDGDWEKIGRLKKTAQIDGKLTLNLYPNIYKYVTEESVEKESDDHYFGVVCTKQEECI